MPRPALLWLRLTLGALGFLLGALLSAAEPSPRVGVLNDNYPFSFRQPNGELAGFAYDIVREVEQVMALKLDRVVGTTGEINAAFTEGRLDMLQSFASTPERDDFAEFSFPYLTMTGAIIVRDNEHGVVTLADLKGRRVAVHRGSLGEGILRRAGLAESIVYVDSVAQALEWLDRGKVDATLASRLTSLALAHHLGLKHIKPVEGEIAGYEVKYCIAVRQGDHRLLARVNEGLAIIVRTGRFDQLYAKWFSALEPRAYSEKDILLAVAGGLALALLVAVWAVMRQRRLRYQLAWKADRLRDSEEKHRAVFEGARDGLVVLGPRWPAGDFPVEQLNPAALRLFALAAEPPPGASLRKVLPMEAGLPDLIATMISDRMAEREYERVGGAGWWRVSAGPLGTRTLVTLVDVTADVEARHRKRVQEDQLQHAQKLEAIGTLAGGVAHDFNNLLTAIVCNTELSLLTLPRNQPEVGNLQQVIQAAARARQLVRQILTFSRRSAPTRESLVVSSIVAETLNFLRTVARGAVEFEYKPAQHLPRIIADSAQVHQVLMNIGTNAVQVMRSQGGVVTITEEEIMVDAELRAQHPALAPGRFVRIGFQDTGPGMTEAVKKRIFEPYFTTKAPGEGTGLGLAVVHGIMERHGGAVTVYSQPGRGTVFHLYFPVSSSNPADLQSTDEASVPMGQGERVLVVDDDAAIVRIVEQVLTRLGYRVSVHTHPDTALADFTAAPDSISAVISDLTMPGKTGLELAARIRVLRPNLPFVLASGFFSVEEQAAAAALGITQLLQKPLTYVSLGRAVAQGLRQGEIVARVNPRG